MFTRFSAFELLSQREEKARLKRVALATWKLRIIKTYIERFGVRYSEVPEVVKEMLREEARRKVEGEPS